MAAPMPRVPPVTGATRPSNTAASFSFSMEYRRKFAPPCTLSSHDEHDFTRLSAKHQNLRKGAFSMSFLSIARPLFIACTAGALLAGCSSNTGYPSSTLAPPSGGAAAALIRGAVPSMAARPNAAARPNHHKSWVSPDAKRAPRLLFISDYGASDVNIFTLPDLTLKGTLDGPRLPGRRVFGCVGEYLDRQYRRFPDAALHAHRNARQNALRSQRISGRLCGEQIETTISP